MSGSRRTFLKALASATAGFVGLHPFDAVADAPAADEFFIFIHAQGGWDVTLSLDPRNERRGLIDPASTENLDVGALKHWVDAPLANSTFRTFRPVTSPKRPGLVLGPAIGDLLDIVDRVTIINGLAMNTVSHPDGSAFSASGRHLAGGHVQAASIDTVIANELGRTQLFPVVSIAFPSSFVGDLDRRVVPLSIGNVGSVSRALSRSKLYDDDVERALVSATLTAEAKSLAARASSPEKIDGFALQYDAARRMLEGNLQEVFSSNGLMTAHPSLPFKGRFTASGALSGAFALEAFKRNLARCVSFSVNGFDTHGVNYRSQGALQQELFGLVTQLVKELDGIAHPTKAGVHLAAHTHVVVISEFCRTPQLNVSMGRDHYPNNSALVISPKFRGGTVLGQSDPEQLLPAGRRPFSGGSRPIAPPDLLATLLSSFKISPQKYLRDGEVVRDLLS